MAMLIFAAGCASDASRSANAVLDIAEKVMDEHPDSALTLLSDTSIHYSSERQRALHALLLTQARHKNYIDETNDSLITTAVNYFDKHGDKPRLMKSLFYKSITNYNAKFYSSGITSAMMANKLAKETNNIYWEARVTEIIGHILSGNHSFDEAANYHNCSAKAYKKLGLEKAHLYSLLDMAKDLNNLHDYESALAITDSILKMSPNSEMSAYCYTIGSNALYYLGKIDKADLYCDSLKKYKNHLSNLDESHIAKIKLGKGNIDEASIALERALALAQNESDSINWRVGMLDLYEKENNYKKAYKNIQHILNHQNNVAKCIREQSAITAQRNFYHQEETKARLEATRHKYLLILGISFCIFIMMILILLFRYKNQKNYAMMQRRISHIHIAISQSDRIITMLKTKLDNEQEKGVLLQNLSKSLFSKQLSHLNMLINEFYETEDSNVARKAIFKHIQQKISKLTDSKNIAEIEEIVNSMCDNIIIKMKQQLPQLSLDDINLITLTIAGYGAKAISLFMNAKPNTIYVRRKRLLERIAKSDAPDREWFISQINGSEPRA